MSNPSPAPLLVVSLTTRQLYVVLAALVLGMPPLPSVIFRPSLAPALVQQPPVLSMCTACVQSARNGTLMRHCSCVQLIAAAAVLTPQAPSRQCLAHAPGSFGGPWYIPFSGAQSTVPKVSAPTSGAGHLIARCTHAAALSAPLPPSLPHLPSPIWIPLPPPPLSPLYRLMDRHLELLVRHAKPRPFSSSISSTATMLARSLVPSPPFHHSLHLHPSATFHHLSHTPALPQLALQLR